MGSSCIDGKDWVLIGFGIFAVTAFFYAVYTSRCRKSKEDKENED